MYAEAPEAEISIGKRSNRVFWVYLTMTLAFLSGVILFCFRPHSILSHTRYHHIPLHSSLEAFGTIASCVMGAVFLLSREKVHVYRWSCPLAIGFIMMGVFDGMHAVTGTGNAFVYLHSLAMLLGGLGFALILLPPATCDWLRHSRPTQLVLLLIGLYGALITVELVPAPSMIQGDTFTPLAVAINLVAGLLFLLASVRLFLECRAEFDLETYLMGVVAALSALAGLTFQHGEAWHEEWWAWHFLRVAAFAIALVVMLRCLRRTMDTYACLLQEHRHLGNQLKNRNREMKQLLYVASHDLRSPLVNVQGFSQELAMDLDELQAHLKEDSSSGDRQNPAGTLIGERIPESLRYIQLSVTKMDRLLSGLLQISRIGRVALKLEPIDMNRLLQDVVDAHQFALTEAGMTIHCAPLPPCYGDATQLHQVFSNLVSNAIKYRSPDRPGEVRISAERGEGCCTYHVADNGLGIAQEHREQVFSIYHRLRPDETEGEGLGLSIVESILGRLHGDITLTSEAGRGSTFSVTLPQGSRI